MNEVCSTYKKEYYYINTMVDGLDYQRHEMVVSAIRYYWTMFVWAITGRKFRIFKNFHVLRETKGGFNW